MGKSMVKIDARTRSIIEHGHFVVSSSSEVEFLSLATEEVNEWELSAAFDAELNAQVRADEPLENNQR